MDFPELLLKQPPKALLNSIISIKHKINVLLSFIENDNSVIDIIYYDFLFSNISILIHNIDYMEILVNDINFLTYIEKQHGKNTTILFIDTIMKEYDFINIDNNIKKKYFYLFNIG